MSDAPREHDRWRYDPQHSDQEIFSKSPPLKWLGFPFIFRFLSKPKREQERRSKQESQKIQRGRFHAPTGNFVGGILPPPKQFAHNHRRKIAPPATLGTH